MRATATGEKWGRRFGGLATYIAQWSKDESTRVGAVIFDNQTRQIIATGYNGPPRGFDDSLVARAPREYKLATTVHAELNALLQAARHGTALEGKWLVTTLSPCSNCAAAIVQTGIERVIVPDVEFPERWRENFELGREIMTSTGIVYQRWPVEWFICGR